MAKLLCRLLFLWLLLIGSCSSSDKSEQQYDDYYDGGGDYYCELPTVTQGVLKNAITGQQLDAMTRTWVPRGTRISLSCNPGFQVTQGDFISVCDEFREFDPPLGKCQPSEDDNEVFSSPARTTTTTKRSETIIKKTTTTSRRRVTVNKPPPNPDLYRQLGQAATSGNVHQVKRILTLYGDEIDVNWRDRQQYLYECGKWRLTLKGSTILHRATAACNDDTPETQEAIFEIVQMLLDHGARVNLRETSPFSMTPLQLAANGGYLDTVRLLLENGADVDAVDKASWTALFYAISRGLVDVAKLLIDSGGANVNAKAYRDATCLIEAAKWGFLDTVRLLLDHGADINAANSDGETALIKAAKNLHLDVIRLLVKRGA